MADKDSFSMLVGVKMCLCVCVCVCVHRLFFPKLRDYKELCFQHMVETRPALSEVDWGRHELSCGCPSTPEGLL